MEFYELAIKKALAAGATEVEAYVQRKRTTRMEFADRIENCKTVESLGISLRVAMGKRIALCSNSILNENEIAGTAVKAVQIAKVAPEDPNWKHLNKKFGRASAEGYFDSSLENPDYSRITERLTSAIDVMKDHDKRVKPSLGFLEIYSSTVSIANSHGERNERKETGISIGMRTTAEEGEMKSTGVEYREARFWNDMKFEEAATKSAEQAVRFLRAKPMASTKTAVIIKNKVFADIFGVLMGEAVKADGVQQGRSPLAGKLGTQIAAENLAIVDDALMRGGWQTKPFDDEGHPTQTTPIVEGGTLKNYLFDAYTALKGNVESTGNAQRRAYWTSLEPAISNLVLKPGRASPEEIIRDTKDGVFVEETIGEWLSNPVSGELNATVTQGYTVKNGELKDPIKGVVISGNFYELLKNGFEMLGNDLANSRETYSPTVKLKQLSIAGKD